jgi:hypothetical protein
MVVETLKAGVCIVERTCRGLQTMEPRISDTTPGAYSQPS